jgi:phospholipid transport system substrate-binding protein
VQTTAILVGQSPFRVDFWVSDASGRTKFFNIIIEGVNMLLSERSEIQAMLDQRRRDIDRLIADLPQV